MCVYVYIHAHIILGSTSVLLSAMARPRASRSVRRRWASSLLNLCAACEYKRETSQRVNP